MISNFQIAETAIKQHLTHKNKVTSNENIIKSAIEILRDLIQNKSTNQASIFLELLIHYKVNQSIFDIILYFLKNNEHKEISYKLLLLQDNSYNNMKELFKIYSKNLPTMINKYIFNLFKTHYNNFKHDKDKEISFEFVGNNLVLLDENAFLENYTNNFFDKIIYNEVYSKLYYKIINYYINYKNPTKEFYELIAEHLVKFTKNKNKNYVLKTLYLLIRKDKIHRLKTETPLLSFNAFNEVLCDSLRNGKDNIEVLKNIILSSNFILKTELNLFLNEIMNNYQDEKNENAFELLKAVIKIIGFEHFYNLIRSKNFIFKDYIEIFKKSKNNDISLFIELFCDYPNENIFYLFSSFTLFCTDRLDQINILLKLIDKQLNKNEYTFKDELNIKYISLGITNLIDSHLKCLNGNIILDNKISKEESYNIFRSIQESSLFLLFIKLYNRFNFIEIENVISALLKIGKLYEMYNIQDIFETIKNTSESCELQSKNVLIEGCNDIISLLNLSKIFIPYINTDFVLTSKILQLILCKQVKIQKAAYYFLYNIIKYNKNGLCVCDTLVSSEYLNKSTCANKIRLLVLFESFQNCKQCNKENSEYFKKIIHELILTYKTNSSKARKACEELLDLFIDDSNYKNFLINIIAGLSTTDFKIINGSICCLIYLIKNRKEFINKNYNLIIEQSILLSKKGKECHNNIIDLYKTIILEYADLRFLEYLDNFALNKRKKTTNHLKKAAIELKEKNIQLSKELNNILKIKFKKRNDIKMVLNKKGTVELMENKVEYDSDSD